MDMPCLVWKETPYQPFGLAGEAKDVPVCDACQTSMTHVGYFPDGHRRLRYFYCHVCRADQVDVAIVDHAASGLYTVVQSISDDEHRQWVEKMRTFASLSRPPSSDIIMMHVSSFRGTSDWWDEQTPVHAMFQPSKGVSWPTSDHESSVFVPMKAVATTLNATPSVPRPYTHPRGDGVYSYGEASDQSPSCACGRSMRLLLSVDGLMVPHALWEPDQRATWWSCPVHTETVSMLVLPQGND